jgi:choline dehydrogenase-like flavoprotein
VGTFVTSAGAIVSFADVRGRTRVEDTADVVVIGTGVAGATAARVLTEAGLDVVMVEEGPYVRAEELCHDAWGAFRQLWRDAGLQVASGRAFLPVLQGRAVGGTTVINGAIIHRLPERVHEQWRQEGWIDETLSWDALERISDVMDRELSVTPTSDDVLGGNNALMEQGLRGIGAEGQRIRRNVDRCLGSAHCSQGCPQGRKQSMLVSYVPRAVQRGARVYAESVAETLIVEHGRAAGVVARFRSANGRELGPELAVRARRAVIVAASAIQTPIFLARNGVGRASGLVGRRLQAHPATSVMGVFDDPVGMWHGATQGYETTQFWGERQKYEAVSVPLEIAAARLPGLGATFTARAEELGHVAQWGVQVRATAHGLVRRTIFGGTSIAYDLRDEDVRRYKIGVRRLVEMMFAAGARAVYPGVYGLPERIESVNAVRAIDALPDDPRRFHLIAAHFFGTAVMHPDARRGVVNTRGESHEVPGLFVADSSVFPTNLGVNPQHAIGAVAWRFAEKIAEA